MADILPTKKAEIALKKPTFKLSSGPIEIVYGDKRKSEEIYRTIFENTGTAMIIVEDNSTISLANNEFEKMSGYSRSQIENVKKWPEFFIEDDLKFMEKYHRLRRIFTGIVPRNYEAHFRNRNGKIRNVYLTVSVVPDTKKSVISIMDITKQKDIEKVLEKRIRELDTLYHTHSRIRIANSFGFVLSNIAKDIVNFFPRGKACIEIVFDNKHYRTRHHKDMVYEFERPIMVHGVQRGAIRVGCFKSESSTEKSLLGYEERKLIEIIANMIAKHAISREVVERYQKVIQQSITGIYIIEDGIIRYANAKFCKIFRCSKNKIVDHPISNFLINCPFYKRVISDPKISSLHSVVKGRRDDGKEIDLQVVYQKINYHGKPGALGRVHDITKIKKVERRMSNFNEELKKLVEEKTHHLEIANKRLQSLNELKDEFIAVASHELRSPLTSIRGYLSFLVEKESLNRVSDDMKQYLLRAYNNAESLNHLVNNILDVSRLETGRFELQTVNTDLIKLAQNIIDSLLFQANEKNIEVAIKDSMHLEKLVIKIDPIRISQVLRNLLDNAIKYSRRDKRIVVEISTDMGFVFVKIKDQGVGIPKTKIKYIFDKFSRYKSSEARFKGGAGLGLFIAKRIIQLHGGIIKVQSQKNKGTTFTIQLPLINTNI